MALVRYDPLREVAAIQNELRRSLETMFRGIDPSGTEGSERTWLPAVDVKETDKELLFTFDLPGMKEEDIAIEVQDNVLSVSGERREEREEKGEGFRRVERRFGRFARSFPLSSGVSEDDIKAEYHDGVLRIRVPKPKAQEPRRVQIGSGAAGGTTPRGSRQSRQSRSPSKSSS
jgi:HSP20 family protein